MKILWNYIWFVHIKRFFNCVLGIDIRINFFMYVSLLLMPFICAKQRRDNFFPGLRK